MGGISTLEIEKNGISCTKEEAEGRANWLSYVRDKEAGTYSLSLRDNNPQKGDHVKHYRIQMHGGNGFIINKQSVFPMLLWRVCHYQRMVKEEPIEAANENTNLLCPLKKEEELKKTEQNAALGEENTSLPPASNYKTWIAKFFALVCILIAYELKNKWMSFLMFGILFSGANGQGGSFQLMHGDEKRRPLPSYGVPPFEVHLNSHCQGMGAIHHNSFNKRGSPRSADPT